MTKQQLRVGTADFLEPFYDFFAEIISLDFDVTRDDVFPQLLLFGDKNFGHSNLRHDPGKVFKLFYTGENERFWDYRCHAAITFDHIYHPMHYRLPLYVTHAWDYKRSKVIRHNTYRKTYHSFADRKFCSFVVKNPGCSERNGFFHKVNNTLAVDSGGPLFNNIGGLVGSGDFSVSSKLKFLEQYRFNICFENASHPGYVTEKIYQALLAGTVPVYWGCPVVDHDFNRKAFLNRNDFNSDEELIEEMLRINSCEESWNNVVSQSMTSTFKYFDLSKLRLWLQKTVYPKLSGI